MVLCRYKACALALLLNPVSYGARAALHYAEPIQMLYCEYVAEPSQTLCFCCAAEPSQHYGIHHGSNATNGAFGDGCEEWYHLLCLTPADQAFPLPHTAALLTSHVTHRMQASSACKLVPTVHIQKQLSLAV